MYVHVCIYMHIYIVEEYITAIRLNEWEYAMK